MEWTRDVWELMRERHSVRRYLDRPIESDKAIALQREIDQCNQEGGLSIQLVTEEPEAFAAGKPHYGAFAGCRNYLVMVGPKGADEAVGYYGERLVLLAQQLGLNTCWVALTYKKGKVSVAIPQGQQIHVVIALGYGETQGTPHKSRAIDHFAHVDADTPVWFLRGVEAAMLAPTAINQQKFAFALSGDSGVVAKAKMGPCSKIDLRTGCRGPKLPLGAIIP